AEVCDLRWDQIDFTTAVLAVRRVKAGTPSTHPLSGIELRALRRLQRESVASPFIFVSERGAPFSTAGFARMIERAGKAAQLEFPVHPHMLRHACGFALANKGRHTKLAGLPRPPLHSAYGTLHRAFARAVRRSAVACHQHSFRSARSWPRPSQIPSAN